MANTYSQITIHAVFAVKQRENFIAAEWRDQLHQYISGIITSKGSKSLAVGGCKDHVHMLFGMAVKTSIADLVGVVKSNSSKWVNEQHFVRNKFHWQDGDGAFSFAKSQRDIVIKYIMNQEEHHRIETFKEEYVKMLNDFDVSYDHKYLFEFFD